MDALRSKTHPGRPSRLDDEQQRQLVTILLQGPRQAGYMTDLWTCRRIAEVISRTFDVTYHPSHVWKVLRGLGWTCQKPERRARERNEEAIADWRKFEWPRIKGGPSVVVFR